MVRTSARPPRSRTDPPPPPPAAARVPQRYSTHLRDAFLLFAAGLLGNGLVDHEAAPMLGPALLGGSLVAAVLLAFFGERRRRRLLLQDRVMEGLVTEPSLRFARLDRQSVKLVRWSRWWADPPAPRRGKHWLGLPRRVVIRFAPSAQDGSPDWSVTVLQIVANRLGAPYTISLLDHVELVMWLELSTEVTQTIERPASEVRALKAFSKLIDPSVRPLDVQFDDDGELTAIQVAHDAPEKMVTAGAQVRLERYVNALFPGRWRVALDTVGDTVRAELRPKLPKSIWLPEQEPVDVEDLLANYEKVTIPYARDEDGNEISWQPAIVPQMLITGGTGTGKTSTTHAILGGVCKYGWPVLILDGKGGEFTYHRTWPNVQIVASSVPEQVALVHYVYKLMRHRQQLEDKYGVGAVAFEPYTVILDEWSDFVPNLMDWYSRVKQKGDPTKPPTLMEHASLIRQGRKVRIHIIQTMQRADVSMFGTNGGEVRSNFGQRLLIGRADPQAAMMMWNSTNTGTTIPRGLRQRGITTDADGMPREVQFYRFPSMTAPEDSEEGALRDRLRPPQARHPRLLILPPDDQTKLDVDGEPQYSFDDYADAQWVRADARPDLDPVRLRERNISLSELRREASFMAVLGLRDSELARELDPTTPGQDTPAAAVAAEQSTEPLDEESAETDEPDGYDELGGLDEFDGYAPAEPLLPGEAEIGVLIQADTAAGGWAVVDEDPEEDLLDEGMTVISWRDDTDQAGVISVPTDTRILMRRPEEAS